MPAIVAFGASFGVLARAAGVDSLAALVMSATTFAGSAQFAVVSVLGAGGTAAAAIGAAVLLNARYVPMALAASDAFRGGRFGGCSRPSCSWTRAGRSRAGEGGFDRRVLIGAGGLLYLGWIAGTRRRRARGGQPHRPRDARPRRGLPGPVPGAAGAPRSRIGSRCSRRRSGAGIALVLTPVTPAGLPVIAATAACLVGLTRPAAGRARGGRPCGRRRRAREHVWLCVLVVGRRDDRHQGQRAGARRRARAAARAARVVDLLAPALLAALVATQAFASDDALVLDERAAGLLAAGVAILLGRRCSSSCSSRRPPPPG